MVKRKTKAKPKAKRTRKPKRTEQLCCGCMKVYPIEEITVNENGSPRCFTCLPPKRRSKKQDQDDEMMYYVLAVEPGTDGRVRKDVLRKSKIERLDHLIKRVWSPKKFEEMVTKLPGEVVFEGRADTMRLAHIKGQAKCKELAGMSEEEIGPDGASATPGFRYTIHQAPGKEKGKEGNDYVYKVRTCPPGQQRKVVQVRKYPGYLIVKMVHSPETALLLKRIRGSWGLLLKREVDVNHVIKVSESKRYDEAYFWKLHHPETKKIVKKGGPFKTKEAAQHEAEKVKAEMEEFRPVPLKTKEAAEELIAQKAVNQIAKDKEERDKAVLKFRVNSYVEIIGDGAFRGVCGTVKSINKNDPANVLANLEVIVLENKLDIAIPHYELKVKRF